jgi:hypothetical protein
MPFATSTGNDDDTKDLKELLASMPPPPAHILALHKAYTQHKPTILKIKGVMSCVMMFGQVYIAIKREYKIETIKAAIDQLAPEFANVHIDYPSELVADIL